MMDAKTIRDLVGTIRESSGGTSAYDTTAQVLRVEGGTAWVHIPGGVDETPVALSINAIEGDTVRIRVSGGQAWIMGNDSAPPTDDRTANTARAEAETAQTTADAALRDAKRAAEAADSAEMSATSARESAISAQTAATQAEEQAESATTAASTALAQLSTVEDVVGTLAWISEHGTYKATTDTEKAAGKYYFARSEQYALTEDTAIDPEKTYYTRSGSGTEQDPYVYTEVVNPDVQDIGTYYELSYSYSPVAVPDGADPAALGLYELDSIDEAVSNYVAAHLALTDEGLYVSSSSNGWRVLIASDGVYIINTAGTIVAQYKDTVRIGETGKHHIELSSTQMKFVNEDQDVVGEMGTHAGTVAYQVDDEIIFTGHPADEDAGGTSYGTFDVSLAHTPILSSTSTITVTLNLIYTQSGDARVAVNSVTISQADTEYEMLAAIYYPDIFWVNFYIQYVSADDVIRIRTNPTDGKVYSYYDTVDFEFVADYSYLGTGSEAPYYTFGTRQAGDNIGAYSVVAGYDLEASGANSFAEGSDNEAQGDNSHAEGTGNLALGIGAHAEGKDVSARGEGAHAEGVGTRAIGEFAIGARGAHAEGIETTVIGDGGHAEGYQTTASGPYSHAGGIGTLAYGEGQTVIGKYNKANATSVFLIGNGENDTDRENSFEAWKTGAIILRGDLPSIKQYNTDMSTQIGQDVPSVGTSLVVNQLIDADGLGAVSDDLWKSTADDLRRGFLMQRYNSAGTLIKNGFYLAVNASGNPYVEFTQPKAWRTGLGVEMSIRTVNGSSVSIPTATDTTLCNTGSLAAGHYYLIIASCNFQAANTTGRRAFFLATSNTGGYQDRFCVKWIAPTPGSNTFSQLTYITYISSATTFYLRAYQNSGSAMNVQGGLRILTLQ